MRLLKKQVITLFVATLLLASIAFLIEIKPANAAVAVDYDTFAFVMVSPNPVGIGQTALVTFRIDKTNPLTTGVISGERWEGFQVKITKPSGAIETKGPYEGDPTGGSWFLYAPTEVGTYYFQTIFPGQIVNVSSTDLRYYKPSTSALLGVTVQQTAIQGYYQTPPLPNDYWSRPINSENKNWWQVADDWLMKGYDRSEARPFAGGTAYAPYTSAPNSAHVLWKNTIYFGGIVGGAYGDISYYTGLAYEQFFNSMIQQGILFYTVTGPTSSSDSFGTRFLSLYTGEEIDFMNTTNIYLAQNLFIDIPNEHGVLPYLWAISGTTGKMYDSFNRREMLTITNIPSGTDVFGTNGEILRYGFSGTSSNRRLYLWNSTLAILGPGFAEYWSPRVGTTIDGNRGIQWNVSIPAVGGSQSIKMIGEGVIVTGYQISTVYPNIYAYQGYPTTLQRDSAGIYPTSISQLWAENRTNLYGFRERIGRNINGGVYTQYDEPTMRLHGYDAKTGREIWITEPLPMSWGIFGATQTVAYGKAIRAGYDGYVRAYDAKNGSQVWEYFLGTPGYLENAYGVYPVQEGFTIADKKVFVTSGEHSPDPVIWRGGRLWAIDTDTGKEVWSINGRFRHPTVADGILVALNSMDGVAYAFGKGPSKTTVSAPQTALTHGSALMITGSVTDQSPASKDTPAISDESMGAWMEYLHMQKVLPGNATGVLVTLTANDPNGNTQNIGTVKTDLSGKYGFAWTPPVEGNYRITATFAGTESYSSSFDSTYMVVGPAATPQPTSTPTSGPSATVAPTITPTATASPSPVPNTGAGLGTEVYIAIASAAVIAVVAAAALILRKRK
jgi:hypothetical protein